MKASFVALLATKATFSDYAPTWNEAAPVVGAASFVVLW